MLVNILTGRYHSKLHGHTREHAELAVIISHGVASWVWGTNDVS